MSAVVLAGGISKRFGQDKGLVRLADKPLILHVLGRLANIIDDIIVVVNSEAQKKKFSEVINGKAHVTVDTMNVQTPLAGALTGFGTVQSEHALLLACDTPFLSSEILSFLLDVCINKAAAIPRWPDGNIEPLHAAYHTSIAVETARNTLESGQIDMRSMITKMHNIRYISTLVLQQFDPKLTTFFNINTPIDLKKAEVMVKQHAY